MAKPKDHYIARLKAVPLFASLSKRELDLLLRQADSMRYPPRYRIVREGANGEEFWMVIEGELAVHRGGEEVARLGPGDFFGELAVIDSTPRDATVVSTTPVELLVIARRRFWATLEESPVLMRKVIIGLAKRLHELEAKDSALRAAAGRTIDLRTSETPVTSG
jgi:CRP/FNR family cyclic AMP-dependent transcriptional regulator